MPPAVQIERLDCFTDPRGLVFEPATPEELPGQGNVHVTLTEPGCVRGNHFHERGSEITVVLGPALARYLDEDAVKDAHVPEGEVWKFLIPAGVPHAFQNTGNGPLLLLGFNTEKHDPAAPDVKPFPLIAPPA